MEQRLEGELRSPVLSSLTQILCCGLCIVLSMFYMDDGLVAARTAAGADAWLSWWV
jgi:hypothetical protein